MAKIPPKKTPTHSCDICGKYLYSDDVKSTSDIIEVGYDGREEPNDDFITQLTGLRDIEDICETCVEEFRGELEDFIVEFIKTQKIKRV